MMDYVLDMMSNVLSSQKWCEPTSYRWDAFHESCLNESTHLQDWSPCGRFSLCKLGGLDNTPSINITVQKSFGINVTFLYFKVLLIRNRWGTRKQGIRKQRYIRGEKCHPPYMLIKQGPGINRTLPQFDDIMYCGKRDMWSELMYANVMIIEFEFNTYLKHSVTVMLIYEALDKRDFRNLYVLDYYFNLGYALRPLNLERVPYVILPYNENSKPFLCRFNLQLPIMSKMRLNYISG